MNEYKNDKTKSVSTTCQWAVASHRT